MEEEPDRIRRPAPSFSAWSAAEFFATQTPQGRRLTDSDPLAVALGLGLEEQFEMVAGPRNQVDEKPQ
ncbi:hypothetical protein M2222_005087 [Bradyrhizobium elkanii]|jgi:hypothetical protein|nr:hypothetical protein [Bradyrhizobium elkanii]MCW2353519.1 hypothetical protein [Bradyrhizobium elkanii]MCW2371125.1 hypothetical protein [Bradyrhizobium elkanii]